MTHRTGPTEIKHAKEVYKKAMQKNRIIDMDEAFANRTDNTDKEDKTFSKNLSKMRKKGYTYIGMGKYRKKEPPEGGVDSEREYAKKKFPKKAKYFEEDILANISARKKRIDDRASAKSIRLTDRSVDKEKRMEDRARAKVDRTGLRESIKESLRNIVEERKESSKVVGAFVNKQSSKGARSHTDGSGLYLHGSKIAHHGENGKIHATMAGYPTKTTRDRLNTLSSRVGGQKFYQKKGKHYYGDKEIGPHDQVDLKEMGMYDVAAITANLMSGPTGSTIDSSTIKEIANYVKAKASSVLNKKPKQKKSDIKEERKPGTFDRWQRKTKNFLSNRDEKIASLHRQGKSHDEIHSITKIHPAIVSAVIGASSKRKSLEEHIQLTVEERRKSPTDLTWQEHAVKTKFHHDKYQEHTRSHNNITRDLGQNRYTSHDSKALKSKANGDASLAKMHRSARNLHAYHYIKKAPQEEVNKINKDAFKSLMDS